MSISRFKAGDVLISERGKYPFTLRYDVAGEWSRVYGTYIHNGKPANFENARSLKLYEEDSTVMENTKTLYTFKDEDGTDMFGTAIGQNSSGQLVIEVKGARGGVILKDLKDLTEVLPYTFSVAMGGKEIHYVGEPGKLAVGDLLLHNCGGTVHYQIVSVTGVDTKCKTARAKFKGRRVVTEEI
jgi:hypothetical protein